MPDQTHQRPGILLPASEADRRPRQNPLVYAALFLALAVADVCFLYHLAETPGEFLAILALLTLTGLSALQTLAKI